MKKKFHLKRETIRNLQARGTMRRAKTPLLQNVQGGASSSLLCSAIASYFVTKYLCEPIDDSIRRGVAWFVDQIPESELEPYDSVNRCASFKW